MDQQQMTTTEVNLKRKAATKLWVYYASGDSKTNELIGFDYKSDLDTWLAENPVKVLEIIRGVRKDWTAQTRVTLT